MLYNGAIGTRGYCRRSEKMGDNVQTTETTSEPIKDRPVAMAVWDFLFLIGCTSSVLATAVTAYNVFGQFYEVHHLTDLLTIEIPFLIGIPATLLSIVQAFIFRLNRFPVPVMMLLVYILIIGCILPMLFLVGIWACRVIGWFLAPVLWIPLFIGIPAIVMSIKCALTNRPSRLHLSLMLLLNHSLVFALNFCVGVAASC